MTSRKGRHLEDDDEDSGLQAPKRGSTPSNKDSKQSFADYAPDHQPASNWKDTVAKTTAGRNSARSPPTSPKQQSKSSSVAQYIESTSVARRHKSTASTEATPRTRNEKFKPTGAEQTEEELNDSFVGAVAVGRSDQPVSYRQTANYQGVIHEESTVVPPQQEEEDKPIVAECVDDTDIEAQVQDRMRDQADGIADMVQQRLMQNAVVAEVQRADEDNSTNASRSVEDSNAKQRKIIWFSLLGLLVLVIVVATAVGVSLRNKDDEPVPSPTPSPGPGQSPSPTAGTAADGKCSFCFDGSTPVNLDTNMVGDQTCAEYRESHIELDADTSDCPLGQSVAWLLCGCPTLPPPLENPSCSICEDGADPSGLTGNTCIDLDTLVGHVGSDPLFPCEELVASAIEGGCVCPGGTPPPDVDETDAFRSVLVSVSGDAIDDETSPQYKALQWIANDDPAETSIGVTPIASIKERYVAAVIYFALEGEGWSNQYSFLSASEICSWNQGGFAGLVCNSNDSIISLRLSNNGAVGRIPKEISYYGNLRTIELTESAIVGTIPTELAEVKNLQELDLSKNSMSGTIPDFLFTHAQLTSLTLDGNSFTGTLSPSLGTSPRLEEVLISNSRLSGPIPTSIGSSSVLTTLDIGRNSMSGTIPEFSTASQFQHLWVNQNNLVGTVPSTIASVPSLLSIHAGSNGLSGTIPDFAGNRGGLSFISLASNKLSGNAEVLLTSTPPSSLRYLDIDGNLLTGTIPSTIGQFTQLTDLRFQDNRFSGPIPTQIGELAALSGNLLLNLNQFNGTIPSEIGRLTRLSTEIRLNNNELTGPLPSEIGNLANVENLYLQNNRLEGDIPPEIGNCQGLVNLYLANNTFTGAPSELGSLPNLEIFYIPDNLIASPVPIMQSSKLIELQIQRNDFTGDIGEFIDALPPSVATIDTDNNDLSGQLPLSIGKFTDLSFFDVQSNALDGTIPEAMGDLGKLSTLNLGFNNFSGTIPESVQSLPFLNTVFLDGNEFTGSIDGFCGKNYELFSAVSCTAPTNTFPCSCCTHCCFTEGDALRCNEL